MALGAVHAAAAALMAVLASTTIRWGWRVGARLPVASDTLIGIGLAKVLEVSGRPALLMAA
jgi:hypothetical protein